MFDTSDISKANGNYLPLSVTFDGEDKDGNLMDNDEYQDMIVILGDYSDGHFEEKCRYGIKLQEGKHNYLIRCSSDYYWYLNEINAARLQVDGRIYDISLKILRGD